MERLQKIAQDEIKNPARYQPICRGKVWALFLLALLAPVIVIYTLYRVVRARV